MIRGQKEKECFEYIQKELFHDKAFKSTPEEIANERVFLTKHPAEHFFAMAEEDIINVEDAFLFSKPNNDLSAFPDFVFDKGFIEHFQITSSNTTRKGAEHRKAFASFEKEFEEKVEILKAEMSETPSYGEIREVSQAFTYQQKHSHYFLLKSLKRSLEEHLESLEKYSGSSSVKIFMIEYDENKLHMAIDYGNIKAERVYGDLLRREKTTEYRLSRDKEALKYLYENRTYIDYVVFCTNYNFEIINVADIPEIIKLLPFDYDIHPVILTTISTMYGTSVPMSFSEDDYEVGDNT